MSEIGELYRHEKNKIQLGDELARELFSWQKYMLLKNVSFK